MMLQHGIDQPKSVIPSSPGTWFWEGADKYVILVEHCPVCRHVFRFAKKVHKISVDGAVSPSVVCPWRGCGFHEFVQLSDWGGIDKRTT